MIEGIIFDLDGVLLDVSDSYREAIRLTVEKLTRKNISTGSVSGIKKIPGFNNDWDASYALIESIKSKRKKIPLTEKEKKSAKYRELVREFQKIYEEKELIKKDKLLIDKKLLRRLSKKFVLGIVTGRPKKEALLAFRLNKLNRFFSEKNLVALEDCKKEKPNPEPLLNALKKMELSTAVYVGDTENDVIAAKAAEMKCIFVGKEKLGDCRIKSVNEIEKAITELDKAMVKFDYFKDSLKEIEPYFIPPENRENFLRLELNESNLGVSPRVLNALKKITPVQLNAYPYYWDLEEEIAKYCKIMPEQVITACAGDEAIKAVFELIEKRKKIVLAWPTYSMFSYYIKVYGFNAKKIPLKKDYSLPFQGILKAIDGKTGLVVIINPDNPTGQVYSRKELIEIIEKAKKFNSIVLVDEAYYEFFGESVCKETKKYPNLVVLRTMSKVFGLASLRIGYLIAQKELISELRKIILPFMLSFPSKKCAIEALKDKKFTKKTAKEVILAREFTSKELKKLGFKVLPSKANFLCAKWNSSVSPITEKLKEKKILIKNISNYSQMKNTLRIGIGSKKQMEYFIREMKKILGELK